MDTPPLTIPSALVESLHRARRIAVLTGAGISAESGVPTFRDAQTGLWAQYDPHELATPQAFARDPKRVWEWYAWRRELVGRAQPNPGHLALAQLEARLSAAGGRFTLITQNVDGLHQRAGSRAVIELHGNLRRSRCSQEGVVVEAWPETGDVPPRCPRCGAPLRPDVVWFNEALPPQALSAAVEAARAAEVFFSIGTSSLVEPAASLPFEALRAGASVVEVNPQRTPLSAHAAFNLRGPAGAVLPEILKALTTPR